MAKVTFALRNSIGDEIQIIPPYYYLQGLDGIGMAPVEYATQQGPYQDGETVVRARLTARTVSLACDIITDTPDAVWTERQALLRMFNYPQVPVYLIATLLDASQRQLDVHYAGELSLPIEVGEGNVRQKVVLQFKAYDPSWYDPTVQTLSFGLGGGGDAFTVPMSVPHGVGASTIDMTQAITYIGTWLSHPMIRARGPIMDLIIQNTGTDEKLDFTGTTIADGDYYDVDCRYGRKTVTDSSGVSKIDKLTSDSDLATFHIERDPVVVGGINSIRVTGSNVNTNTAIDLSYYVRDLGI